MINRAEVVINSRFGHSISNMFLQHDDTSRNLAVLFPGGYNSTDVPTLHYARKAALLSGCDVLSLEYGYGIGYNTLDNENIMCNERKDCTEIIEKVLTDNYAQLFLISKSAGHFIALKIDDRFKGKNIRHICYTPVTENVDEIAKRDCKVFIGTKDKWISREAIERLKYLPNIELSLLENAVHSLEIDNDYKASIRILDDVTDQCASYIKRYMAK